jgi:hypothetical protein
MRMIDKNRLIAMNEIEMRSNSILLLSKEFVRTYKDAFYTNQDKQDIMDDIWRIITEHQIRLTEILRENSL